MSFEEPHWGSIAVGTPGADFEPRPASSAWYRPDTVADGWATDDLIVRLAAVRGYAHRYEGLPRQDDAAAVHHPVTGSVVFAIADGVSSTPLAHIGATAACRAAVTAVLSGLDDDGRARWPDVVERAAWQVVRQAGLVLGLDSPDPERAERQMATTLITGLVRPCPDGPNVELVRIGDGGAWILHDGGFRTLFEPAATPLVPSEVTALPRVPEVVTRGGVLTAGDVLVVGTDGIAEPLGDGSGSVGAYLAERLAVPRPPLTFAHDVDFSRETFDDDRTLLAIWPRQRSRTDTRG
ncbi:protein phosphatase 2C domain-containing protein [Actinoplanes sp. TBRC 11911]|uniref:protein phosphatase 2C domain-containing protein n=1 Tax=Actinoplanes sp. TBRC 11911 TaxID=2729386 RepID=UPI00145E56F9|nr:protein phosphatase 2C domain-containing protein [Actinoplanes sp. TBRC 11911]NMO50891.1 protein phosphatase 2C domain-containing protein [Actinoplanes sp. TBRC 11911]